MHSNHENVHLKLLGDFDGSSAWQLIHMIKQRATGLRKIIIHTSGISSLHPFGWEVFQKESQNFKRLNNNLVFTGEYGDKLMLPGSTLYSG
jgi:anti-anti-sigma regulatory factor